MEFSWTTFILEFVNFLILVWLLKRFLYRPVMGAIGRRMAAVDKTLTDAGAEQAEARELKRAYEDRIAVWNQEKEQVRRRMVQEVEAERTRLLADVRTELDEERERGQALERRRQEEVRRLMEDDAVTLGKAFVTKLLSRLSGPDLEAGLLRLVMEDLTVLPEGQQQALRSAIAENNVKISVRSAFPMRQHQREVLETALNDLLRQKANYEFIQDTSLLAGVCITIGPWVLRANLSDEIGFFTEGIRHVD